MAEKERKKTDSKKQDDKDFQLATSKSGDRPSSRTTVGASTHRPGLTGSHSSSYHGVTTIGSSGERTKELRARFERSDSKDSSGTREDARRRRTTPVEVIPAPTRITVTSTGPVTGQPPPSSSGSTDRGDRYTVPSKIPTKSGYDPVMRQRSKPGDTGGTTSRPQVAASPPMSPPPDKTATRQRPRLGSAEFNILPSQTNPTGSAGTANSKGATTNTSTETSVANGLTATCNNAGTSRLNSSSKASHLRIPTGPSPPQGAGSQSLPSPTTSSGNLSSGEILSSGGLSSGEHPGTATQCKSLNTSSNIYVVDGHGHRSFTVSRQDLAVVQSTNQQLVDRRLGAMATPESQASEGEDDTLMDTTYCSKMLLQNKSLDVTEEGRTILRTVSEGRGVKLKKNIQISQLQEEKKQLEAKLKEKDSELEELRKHLSARIPGDVHQAQGGAAQGGAAQGDAAQEQKEPEYTQQMYINYLTGEVNRLTPLAEENKRLKRQLKHLEEVNAEAKLFESQVVDQVTVISEKDAIIEELKRSLEQGSDTALREQLNKKDFEISRLRARLAMQEKIATGGVGANDSIEASSIDGPHGDAHSPGDITALQTDFEQKLKRKDLLIEKLKRRVNELTEKALAAEAVPHEDFQEKVGVADEEGVIKEHLGVTEHTAQVEKLQAVVKEKDKRIKTMTSQLQSLEAMAGNVVQMQKHSREQSEVVAQLRKQLEAAGDGNQAAAVIEDLKEEIESLKEKIERKEAKLSQKRQEIEHLKKNTSVADATMRKLRIQNSQLEAEKTRLIDEGHQYANTKLEQTEREKVALMKQIKEQERVISGMDVKANRLSQQNRALEEQLQVLAKVKEEKELLEQRILSQLAKMQNLDKELHDTKHRATELYSTLEQQKIEASQLLQARQTLEGEVEAHKMTAQIYREDFETERKDREKAHALYVDLEERYQKEVKDLKQQFQLVSADCGRLTKQLQSEKAEKNKHIEDKIALQGEIQSKTQQVKQYKKQVDQFRGELDHCRADVEAYKQQAEHHKQQIEGTVQHSEQLSHSVRVLQDENNRLRKEINILTSREHLRQHAARSQGQQQLGIGGREGGLISVEEFMKERRKYEELVRTLRNAEVKLEEITLQKVMVDSENEELKKRLSLLSSSSNRSPPPVSQPAATSGSRPPPYSAASNRGQGGSALPNPVRAQHHYPPPNQRLNQQMKSASVDSADGLSSRGYIDSSQYHPPIPSVTVASAIPQPSPTTRPDAAYRDPRSYQHQKHRKSQTSTVPSPQRDFAPVSQSFEVPMSNTNAQAVSQIGGVGRGYPYLSTGHGGDNVPTNAGMGGDGNNHYPAMSSPPTNAKYKPPFATAGAAGGPALMPDQQKSQPPQMHGAQLGPVPSQASTYTSNAHVVPAPNLAQSMAGGRVPPFTGHGPSPPVGPAQTVVSGDSAQRQLYHNLAFEHQLRDQYNMSPPPDDGHSSGHMSLPSFGSGGFQQPQAQSPVHSHQQGNHPYPHQVPKDDMFLLQQQKGSHGGYQRHHPAGEGGARGAYHAAIDVVEKDSSPPSSFVPPGQSQQGPPLSFNPQTLGGLQQPAAAQHHHHQRRSHQHPLSPEHPRNDRGLSGGGANQPHRLKVDGLTPGIRQGSKNDQPQLAPHHGHSAQVYGQRQQQLVQQRQGHNAMGGAVGGVNQQQRPHSHAVKGPIMESGSGPTKLPPSMQKKHSGGGNVYVASQERRNQDSRSPYEMKDHRPEPDSDSVSNVSMESGLNSPTGDGSENTLEKGIDGDIRRAARNVKKQMAGRELSGAGGGVEAPIDPNLTCPSCGLRFRIGEIQKFKRHASTCTGT